MHVAQQLLLKTGNVDSINMKNGTVIPIAGSGPPAGAAMSAVKSLKQTAEMDNDVSVHCMSYIPGYVDTKMMVCV